MNNSLFKVKVIDFDEHEMKIKTEDETSIEALRNFIKSSDNNALKKNSISIEIVMNKKNEVIADLILDENNKNITLFIFRKMLKKFNKLMVKRNILIEDLERSNSIINF